MLYKNNETILSFLNEMSINYNRIIECSLTYIDGDIILNNIGTKGFKLDPRLKNRDYKVSKNKTIYNICDKYKRKLITEDEAVLEIKNKIQELESEVEKI